ncbi:methyltransferase domain-containing protein [Candidatus Foliamicus sp.]
MIQPITHALAMHRNRDARARERFVSGLRGYVLNDLAATMRKDFESGVGEEVKEVAASEQFDGADVHRAMRSREIFKAYSSARCTAQQMVWDVVMDSVEQQRGQLNAKGKSLMNKASAGGTLELDPTLEIPRYVEAVDVHLMPGCYYREYGGDDLAAGAIYDQGLNVFAFGAMGSELNDIGWSMANFYKVRINDPKPRRILDVGCTIGHNTLPWKQVFPDAEVHGVDVAAPCLRYAHARAEAMGVEAHFHQQSAENIRFPDNSVDVVFSSMFLHELPNKAIRKFLAEAHRVLRPGGVLLNMELPPNDRMAAYDQFYLDWDSYYNNEPFYKDFRDQDPRELTVAAGFPADGYFEGVMPRYTYTDEQEFKAVAGAEPEFGEDTGRLSDVIFWYGFGSVKQG